MVGNRSNHLKPHSGLEHLMLYIRGGGDWESLQSPPRPLRSSGLVATGSPPLSGRLVKNLAPKKEGPDLTFESSHPRGEEGVGGWGNANAIEPKRLRREAVKGRTTLT